MRIVIIGGYGAFGALTARLLARDGHKLWLAGRRPEQGRRIAAEIGAETLAVDIAKDPRPLFEVRPDAVIDAAGPFQQYGDDPYRLARLCIENGCHYLDLSDCSDFTKGITVLNAQAERAGVFALSGASSVPGLSSSVVSDLIEGLDQVDLIDIAILPGNRAPRGLSVIKSVVSQVGRPSQVLRDGVLHNIDGWTDRKVYQLEPGWRRAGFFLNVPDVQLLAEYTGARSVMFRAGFELRVMNWGLSLLAKLRKRWRLEFSDTAYRLLHVLSNALYPFGSDRGGMRVSVSGSNAGDRVIRDWTLIAENGDGPYVPGIICRAILRDPSNIRPGARPCLAELPRRLAEDAMADLEIRTESTELQGRHGDRARTADVSLVQGILG